MIKRKDTFYTNFDEFIKEVSLEMKKQNKLLPLWPIALAGLLGASALTPMFAAVPFVGLLSVDIFIKKAIHKQSDPEVLRIKEQVKRAKKIFNYLQQYIDEEEEFVKQEIDELLVDLVENRAIVN